MSPYSEAKDNLWRKFIKPYQDRYAAVEAAFNSAQEMKSADAEMAELKGAIGKAVALARSLRNDLLREARSRAPEPPASHLEKPSSPPPPPPSSEIRYPETAPEYSHRHEEGYFLKTLLGELDSLFDQNQARLWL
jgi:hypothetical protein